MTDSPLFIFATSAALILAMPGPTNAVLMTAGAARGLTSALPPLLAELAGYGAALTLLLSLDSLAGALRGEISLALRATAAVILLATAWRMWRAAALSGAPDGSGKSPGAGNILLLTLFNPKSLILGFVIFPPVVAQGAILPAAGLFALIVVATGFGWIAAGAATRKLPGRPGVAVTRLCSLVIGGFACYFVATIAAEFMPLAA